MSNPIRERFDEKIKLIVKRWPGLFHYETDDGDHWLVFHGMGTASAIKLPLIEFVTCSDEEAIGFVEVWLKISDMEDYAENTFYMKMIESACHAVDICIHLHLPRDIINKRMFNVLMMRDSFRSQELEYYNNA